MELLDLLEQMDVMELLDLPEQLDLLVLQE
jgi:hypothetical protein